MEKYKKLLRNDIRCSEATLDTELAQVDIASIESITDNRITLREVSPSNINGIDVRNHPNGFQRKRFNAILDGGGILGGVFDNSKLIQLCTTVGGKPATALEEFEPERGHFKTGHVTNAIHEIIKGNFEKRNKSNVDRGNLRPKVLSPADFWAQLSPNELIVLHDSEDPDVLSFIFDVNDMNIVPLKSAPVKNGVNLLFVNNIISSKTRSELIGD